MGKSNWEVVKKRSFGAGIKCSWWHEVPCIAINKNNVTFNEDFIDLFMDGQKGILVLLDKVNRKLGFKVPGIQDTGENVRMLQGSKNSRSKAKSISLPGIIKSFPDCVGKVYRAHLNAGERIIEVDLSPENSRPR